MPRSGDGEDDGLDLAAEAAAAAEKAAFDLVEAALLMQRIGAAMSFRAYATTPRQLRRFFDVFEQFSEN